MLRHVVLLILFGIGILFQTPVVSYAAEKLTTRKVSQELTPVSSETNDTEGTRIYVFQTDNGNLWKVSFPEKQESQRGIADIVFQYLDLYKGIPLDIDLIKKSNKKNELKEIIFDGLTIPSMTVVTSEMFQTFHAQVNAKIDNSSIDCQTGVHYKIYTNSNMLQYVSTFSRYIQELLDRGQTQKKDLLITVHKVTFKGEENPCYVVVDVQEN